MKLTIEEIFSKYSSTDFREIIGLLYKEDKIVDEDILNAKFLYSFPNKLHKDEYIRIRNTCLTKINSLMREFIEPYDDFFLKKFLGYGSSGYVVLVVSKYTDNNFVVKVSKKHKNVENEILIFESLEGCNYVPKVIFSTNFNETNFICMEYLSGYHSLKNFNSDFPAGNDNYIVIGKIIRNMIDGLNEIHSRGVVHRDIKPDNILFDLEGNIKFIDFDLSYSMPKPNNVERINTEDICDSPKSQLSIILPTESLEEILPDDSDLRSEISVGGTYGYLAPELVSFNYVKITFNNLIKGDYWSLGITIYFILSGLDALDIFEVDNNNEYNLRNFKSKAKKFSDSILDVYSDIEKINEVNKMSFSLTDMITLDRESRVMKY